MNNLMAEILYFSTILRNTYEDELAKLGSIPSDAIEKVLANDPFKLSNENIEHIRRQLEFNFSVLQTGGYTIKSNYKPWLQNRISDIDFYYWKRLRRYFIEDNILPPIVVSQLDRITNEVLDYCGDPNDLNSWSRRGMVMGHVQMGKTTNYGSLICKAADVGYKIIILLAGLTNSLREQTQERIDEMFIGKVSLYGTAVNQLMPIMFFCDGNLKHPAFGTTRDSDFNRNIANQWGVSLSNLNDPLIFVLKKNKNVLENLYNWIIPQNYGNKIQYPLLLIDDEADSASVNTNDRNKNSTEINSYIRKILNQFDKSSYVGYTATPFANIFIDPDTEDEMLGDDLFPRHFLKALDPPTNYVGAKRVFSLDGDLRETMVNVIDDYDNYIPINHRRNDQIQDIPESLKEAIRVFVLSRAIRILRNDGAKHCSMMINVSRFNNIQDQIAGLVYSYQKSLDDCIQVNSGLGLESFKDPQFALLRSSFEREYSDCGFSFDKIKAVLAEASRSIIVQTVNMKSGSLDYRNAKKSGLHVIAIGGLALSRGLTLEGLTVSYILRNTEASDTLMQMARWFGYRRDYEDICRLYINQNSIDNYVYIEEASDELILELKRMEARGETPEQFGLKVRRSETGIMVTARNKMRTATTVPLVQSFSEKHVEGFALYNDDNVNKKNLISVFDLLAKIGDNQKSDDHHDLFQRKDIDKNFIWEEVDGDLVFELIKNFKFPPTQTSLGLIDGKSSLFQAYVGDRISDELKKWDVVVPLNKGRLMSDLAPKNISELEKYSPLFRKRNQGVVKLINDTTEIFKPMGDKNRISDPNEDPQLLLTEEQRKIAEKRIIDREASGQGSFCSMRQRPLLIIHFLDIDKSISGLKILDFPLVSLSFLMPTTHVISSPKSYEVTITFRKLMEALSAEIEDDDEVLVNV